MKSSQIRDDLKHIRLIHFSLVILSGTMLYLIVAAWSDAPQLYAQLSSLIAFLRDFQTEGIPLREINTQRAADVENQILKDLRGLTTDDLRWEQGSSDPYPPLSCILPVTQTTEKASLFDLIQNATTGHCRFLSAKGIAGDANAMRDWITGDSSSRDWRREYNATGPYVRFMIGTNAKDGPGNYGKVTLEFVGFDTTMQKNPPLDARLIGKDFDLTVTLRSDYETLPVDWLERRFSLIPKYRDAIGVRSPDDALAWARARRVEGIETLKESMFGIKFRAAHVGSIASIIIVAMLVYLLAYLGHLVALIPEQAEKTKESVAYFSPWLGATRGGLALSITSLTLVIFPSCAIVLSLWRFSGWPLDWACATGLFVAAAPGIVITLRGWRLGKRKVEADERRKIGSKRLQRSIS